MLSRAQQEQKVLQGLLKELRSQKGYKQSDIAEKTGFTQSLISKYESGERRLDILELRSICLALGVSLPEFVAELERRLTTIGDRS
jgi:transcriptional regulator with XRE-family HTH domain